MKYPHAFALSLLIAFATAQTTTPAAATDGVTQPAENSTTATSQAVEGSTTTTADDTTQNSTSSCHREAILDMFQKAQACLKGDGDVMELYNAIKSFVDVMGQIYEAAAGPCGPLNNYYAAICYLNQYVQYWPGLTRDLGLIKVVAVNLSFDDETTQCLKKNTNAAFLNVVKCYRKQQQ